MVGFINLPLIELATVMLIFVCAGAVKGLLGFGLPMVSMAALPLVIPVEAALAINAVVLPVTNLSQLLGERKVSNTVQRFWPVLAGLIVGVPIGAALLKSVNESTLLFMLGIFVIVFSLITAFSPKFRIPSSMKIRAGTFTGIIAGAIGALSTVNGPVFVMYLVGIDVQRSMFRSGLALMFLISGLLIAGAFWTLGILDQDRFLLACLCLLPAFIGMWLGNRIGNRVSSQGFRRLVLIALVVLGGNLILRALSGV